MKTYHPLVHCDLFWFILVIDAESREHMLRQLDEYIKDVYFGLPYTVEIPEYEI